MDEKERLEFAYKYPFSNAAKELMEKLQTDRIELKYLDMGKMHIEEAMNDKLEYKSTTIDYAKTDYLFTYLYSRMLLSATKNMLAIRKYAIAEAKRCAKALSKADNSDIIELAKQLGVNIAVRFSTSKQDNPELTIDFADFLKFAPITDEFQLTNQRLSNGVILLYRNNAIRIMEKAMRSKIENGLPIKEKELPDQIIDYSKTLKIKFADTQQIGKPTRVKSSELWIEKLLNTPIVDVRHRTVNLILAPYLVNNKGLEVEQAKQIIVGYIERCKELNPNTKITERYIEYQCAYAKRKGLRPLSFEKAKDLFGGMLDIEALAK